MSGSPFSVFIFHREARSPAPKTPPRRRAAKGRARPCAYLDLWSQAGARTRRAWSEERSAARPELLACQRADAVPAVTSPREARAATPWPARARRDGCRTEDAIEDRSEAEERSRSEHTQAERGPEMAPQVLRTGRDGPSLPKPARSALAAGAPAPSALGRGGPGFDNACSVPIRLPRAQHRSGCRRHQCGSPAGFKRANLTEHRYRKGALRRPGPPRAKRGSLGAWRKNRRHP